MTIKLIAPKIVNRNQTRLLQIHRKSNLFFLLIFISFVVGDTFFPTLNKLQKSCSIDMRNPMQATNVISKKMNRKRQGFHVVRHIRAEEI